MIAEPPALRCPVCRAGDNRTEQCRRCKADLSLLVRLERDRAALLAAAETHAGRGEGETCLRQAKKANDIRADDVSLRLMALGLLLNKQFQDAMAVFQKRAKSRPASKGSSANLP